ncbi:MAG: hypothetical protein ACRD26_20835 [Vicinamibacterales bacterium]
MIDGLIRRSLGHRTIVVALAAGFLVWGAVSPGYLIDLSGITGQPARTTEVADPDRWPAACENPHSHL